MNVGDIMTRRVIAVGAKTPLSQAVRLMTAHAISGVPVLDSDGRVIGLLTEGDLLRRAETGTTGKPAGWLSHLFTPGREARDYIQTHGRRTEEIMTTAVVTIAEDASLAEAVGLMQRNHFKRLPVVRAGMLQGILSRGDIIRYLGSLLLQETISADDMVIRAALITEIEKQPWAPRDMTRISVTNGVVELDGCMFNYDAREALEVLAENISGVKEVQNRIVCVQPYMDGVVSASGAGSV